jgi:hypothetical protein
MTASVHRWPHILLTVLLLVLVARAPVRASRTADPVNVPVSHGHYPIYGEPDLAVNPRQPRNLLGAAQCIDWAASLRVPCSFASFDGGRTWRENGPLPLPPGDTSGVDTTVAFNSHGIGFVAAMASASGPDSVLVWRTADGGRRFSRPVTVFRAWGSLDHGRSLGADHPWLAADTTNGPHAGALYVAWMVADERAMAAPASRLLFSRSSDGGRRFTPPQVIVGAAQGIPALTVMTLGPRGVIHVLYGLVRDRRDPRRPAAPPLLREVVSSADGGRTFGPAHPIAAAPLALRLPQLTVPNIQAAATDPHDGTLYMVMAGYRLGRGARHTDILLWRSQDGGRRWDGPIRVNADPLTAQADCLQPRVAVTARGTVYVSYFWLMHGRVAVYLARSTTQGTRFAPSQRISTTAFDPLTSGPPHEPWIGDYQGLAVGRGVIYPVWNDTRSGHMAIFTAAVPGE